MNSNQKKRFEKLDSVMEKILDETGDNPYDEFIDRYDSPVDLWYGFMRSLEGKEADRELDELEDFLKGQYDVDINESRRPRGRMLKESDENFDVAFVICSDKYANGWLPIIIFKNMNKDNIGSQCDGLFITELGDVYSHSMRDTYIINSFDNGSMKMSTTDCDSELFGELEDRFLDMMERKGYSFVRLDDINQLIDTDTLNKMVNKEFERKRWEIN